MTTLFIGMFPLIKATTVVVHLVSDSHCHITNAADPIYAPQGTTLELNAVSDAGYVIWYWATDLETYLGSTGTGTSSSNSNWRFDSDGTVFVYSAPESTTITPYSDDHSTVDPDTPQSVNFGDEVLFTYSADPGYTLQVYENGIAINMGLHPNSYSVTYAPWDQEINVTSSVSPPRYSNLSPTSVWANQTVTTTSYWNSSTDLSGYIFSTNNTGIATNSTWTAFGATPSWANTTLTLNSTVGNKVWWNVYANDTQNHWNSTGQQLLSLQGFEITISNDTHSTINVTSPVSLCYNGTVAIDFDAEGGYTIQSVILNQNTSVSTTPPYVFNLVRSNQSLSISTSDIVYYVNASNDAGSIIYPSGVDLIYPFETWANFSCSAVTGYTLSGFLINGTDAGTSVIIGGQYSFMPTGNTTLSLISEEVSAPSGGGGGGSTFFNTPTPEPEPSSTTSATTVKPSDIELDASTLVVIVIIVIIVGGVVYASNTPKGGRKVTFEGKPIL